MKRFVGEELILGIIGAVLTLVVVALTGAGAGATYLIAFGFLALLGGIRFRSELEELWAARLKRLSRRFRLVRR
jgi:hypothetical protein